MSADNLTDEQLLERLKIGLERDFIAPWFQPAMDRAGVNMLSAEALPRFIDPEYGIISPMSFLDVADKNGLLAPIGEVLLIKTCTAFASWAERGIAPELVSINLTGLELQADGVVDRIKLALDNAAISPSNLAIEVAENVASEPGAESALANIDRLHEHGVKLIVDDLGVTPVSPETLKRLRTNSAKIDRKTVSELGESDAAEDQVSALAEVTDSLGIPLIAKGVETRIQIDILAEIGVGGQQGFAIARPMPEDSFTEWLDLNTGWDVPSVA